MSFITRCPACHTAFKVVQDQLKISDGWVRCGQCQHIFDATLDLEPWWPGLDQVPSGVAAQRPESQASQRAAQPAQAAPAALQQDTDPSDASAPDESASTVALDQRTTPDAAPPVRPTTPERPWAGALVAPDEPSPEPTPFEAQPPSPMAWPGLQSAPGDAWARGVADVWRTPAPAPDTASEPPAAAQRPFTAVEPRPLPLDSEQDEAAPQTLAAADVPIAPTPWFVRQAQRRAWWQRPAVRLGLGVCCLLLALALALQVAQRWHTFLARQLPAAQPVLDSLCQTLECAPHELDAASAVLIDSSVLLRRAPGLYSFQVLLRNQSAFEVPSPAIELTLTDIHDQVLVRRVLLPQDWPRPRATLAPGAEWSLQFELGFDGVPDRVMTGYRAILFYP